MSRQEELERALAEAEGVLFLCSGNILRSAFAELYARHLGLPLPVRSAATTYVNTRIHPEAVRALRARGVPPERIAAFRPTPLAWIRDELRPEMVAFGMTREHLAALAPLGERAPRGFLLTELLGRDTELADPLLSGEYDETFARIAECVETLVRLSNEINARR